VPTDHLEGRSLGKYRVLEALGRGGMARVYRAFHPQLDRYVAIKVLRSDLVEEAEFEPFQREARAVATLRHPNIVQVFDFDVQDGNYYMVMELLEGDSLRTRLNVDSVTGNGKSWRLYWVDAYWAESLGGLPPGNASGGEPCSSRGTIPEPNIEAYTRTSNAPRTKIWPM
jgi:serine/threonine protein kinase